jgi:hypothetical protein
MEGGQRMLTITVGSTSSFDDEKQEFVEIGGVELQLEHSLVSLSKWESEHEKPFLGKGDKTPEEVLAYVQCMLLTENPPGDFLHELSKENIEAVNAYVDRKMTATWFSDQPGAPASREVITSELIYYWMTVFNIPWEAQYWHLNRLFTLIRICNVKQSKPKKMSRQELTQRNRELNAQRRQQLGTRG